MKKINLLSCFLILFCLSGCFLKKEGEIDIQTIDELALAVDVEWAVVTEPYVSFREDSSWNSKTRGNAKKGDILKVMGKTTGLEQKWIYFNEGYLPESSVRVYSNKYQAQKAVKEMEK